MQITQHKSPFVLHCLILSLMLAFSTVFPAYAQTLDGQISIQLPQGWVARKPPPNPPQPASAD
jgi:hypothetical protein